MIGLTSLEVYNSILKKTEEYNKFELYTANFEKSSFAELKNKLEEILSILDFTPTHLQHEIIGPRNFQEYRKLRSEKSSTDGYFILLMGYARSPFPDFEIYLGIVVGLVKDDIQVIFRQNNSKLVT